MLIALLLLLLPALAEEPALEVETWNVGLAHGFVDHARARRAHIETALQASEADVLCLQEVWDRRDRRRIEKALADRYPHRFVPRVEPERASEAPACKRGELFGEGRFVSCMQDACGDTSGDARTDCITSRCGGALDDLKESNPECATALMAQVGKPALFALVNVLSPLRRPMVFAYRGSNGLMLLSRQPLRDAGILDFTDISTLNRRQALYADVTLDDTDVRVYCTHLTADLSATVPYPGSFDGWAAEQRVQIERLLSHADQVEGPAILLGDFNCGWGTATLDAELPDNCALFDEAGFTDPATREFGACTYCGDNLLIADDSGDKLIDHGFLRGLRASGEGGRRYTDTVGVPGGDGGTMVHLSDHFGYGLVVIQGVPEQPSIRAEEIPPAGEVGPPSGIGLDRPAPSDDPDDAQGDPETDR